MNVKSASHLWGQGRLGDLRNRLGEWKTAAVYCRNSINTSLTQWWRLTILVIQRCHAGTMSSQICCDEKGTSTLWYSFSKPTTTDYACTLQGSQGRGNSLSIPQTVNQLPYDPAIAFLGTQSREMTIFVHIKTCTWMYVASLLIIAKSRNNSNVYQLMNR